MSENGGFGDYFEALRARDSFDDLIVKIIDRERPKYRYATVLENDYSNDTVLVEYPDDPTPIRVQRGNVQPFWPGTVVRVNGRNNDRYIDEGHSGLRLIQSWALNGKIYASRGDDWPYIIDYHPELWVVSLTAVGTSPTQVKLLKNGSPIKTLDFAAGNKLKMTAINEVEMIAFTDFLATEIVTAGTGAQGLVSQLYGK